MRKMYQYECCFGVFHNMWPQVSPQHMLCPFCIFTTILCEEGTLNDYGRTCKYPICIWSIKYGCGGITQEAKEWIFHILGNSHTLLTQLSNFLTWQAFILLTQFLLHLREAIAYAGYPMVTLYYMTDQLLLFVGKNTIPRINTMQHMCCAPFNLVVLLWS